MGPRSCHTAQEGDSFCLLEMNVLVWKVQINPRTAAKDLVKMLEETDTKVSISTVKRVLYRHNLKGRSASKKPLLQHHKKSQTTVCNYTWGQRSYFLEKCPLVWWNKHNCLAIMIIVMFGGKRGRLASQRTPWSKGGSILLRGCFATGGTGALHK